MKNHVFMFQPQFAPDVEAGLKTQTVRGKRKRRVNIGDRLSLRQWLGKPYRSKQRVLREAIAYNRADIRLGKQVYDLQLHGHNLTTDGIEFFARADGFESGKAMFEWFEKTHGLPFEGEVTYWK